jgi:hypothetical protein
VAAIAAQAVIDLHRTRPIGPALVPILDAIAADPRGSIARIDEPRAGERDVLPKRIVAMLQLLEKHDVRRYRYSEAIAEAPRMQQRLVEAAWPRRSDDAAEYLVSYAVEWRWMRGLPPAGCEPIDALALPDTSLGVVLARCR